MFTNYFLKIIYLKIKTRTTTVSVLLLSYINGGNIRHYCCYGCVFLYFFLFVICYILFYINIKMLFYCFEKALFTMFSSSFDNFISRYYNSLKSYIIWFKMKKYFNQIRGYFYQFKYEMQIYNCFF